MNSAIGGLVFLALMTHPVSCSSIIPVNIKEGHCYQYKHGEFSTDNIVRVTKVGKEQYIYNPFIKGQYFKWDSLNHDYISAFGDMKYKELDCPTGETIDVTP